MSISRIEIGPGANPRQDWAGRDDVLYIEEGEWGALVGVPPGTIEEIYLADVLGSWGEKKKIAGFSVPAQLAENYFEMVRWAATFHRLIRPGGIVTVVEDNTPPSDPEINIIEPFTEKGRFALNSRIEIPTKRPFIKGYTLVFQKPE